MRIRKKKWAQPELDASKFYINNGEEHYGKWNSLYSDDKPLYLELGCGKGGFISQAAIIHDDVNWIAADIKAEMLALARRKISAAYLEAGREVTNVHLLAQNIERIETAFSDEDRIDRIYINFCNPWPRGKHKKRRLTHSRQLTQYRRFLKDGAEIHFKTDDDELFFESLEYFDECNFTIKYKTEDLHNSGYEHNIETEHERMFTEDGKTIKFLIAVKNPQRS